MRRTRVMGGQRRPGMGAEARAPYDAPMPNAANEHMAEALERPGCAVCTALAADETRWMEAYWREAMFDDDARARFFDAGGFCRHHAWVLHRQAKATGYGSAVSFLYGNLARRGTDLPAPGEPKPPPPEAPLPARPRLGAAPAAQS